MDDWTGLDVGDGDIKIDSGLERNLLGMGI
jgi:hypothetical protein